MRCGVGFDGERGSACFRLKLIYGTVGRYDPNNSFLELLNSSHSNPKQFAVQKTGRKFSKG